VGATGGQVLMQLGDHRSAAQALETAVRRNGDDAQAHALLCSLYVNRGELEAAVRHARRVTELEPGQSMSWLSLAIVLNEMGRHGEARAALAEARRYPPLPEWAGDLARLIDANAS
jgi:Flp pilus assembly protein TadD